MESHIPSISIYRCPRNLPDELGNNLLAAAQDFDIPTRSLKVLVSPSPQLSMLGSGELLGYLRRIGISPTESLMDELADYLDDQLPDSVDATINVPTGRILSSPIPGRSKKESTVVYYVAQSDLVST